MSLAVLAECHVCGGLVEFMLSQFQIYLHLVEFYTFGSSYLDQVTLDLDWVTFSATFVETKSLVTEK
jgi:hypothetical protein